MCSYICVFHPHTMLGHLNTSFRFQDEYLTYTESFLTYHIQNIIFTVETFTKYQYTVLTITRRIDDIDKGVRKIIAPLIPV